MTWLVGVVWEFWGSRSEASGPEGGICGGGERAQPTVTKCQEKDQGIFLFTTSTSNSVFTKIASSQQGVNMLRGNGVKYWKQSSVL